MSVIRKASAFTGVLLGFCVSTARAQGIVVANIPFAFVVGHTTLPAGRYEIRPVDDDGGAVLAIEGMDNPSEGAFAVTNPAGGRDPIGDDPALVFTHDQNQYRLAEIWDSSAEGRELLNFTARGRRARPETQTSQLNTPPCVLAANWK
jgi:hypothetical protein